MNVNPDARHALQEKSLRIWRVIAASRQGQTLADLVERFKGVYDDEVIRMTIGSLRQSRYCEAQGLGRGSRTVITGKLPLGEQLPAWWGEAIEVEPKADAASTPVPRPSTPAWPFGNAKPAPADLYTQDEPDGDDATPAPAAQPAPAARPRREPAPTDRFTPLFCLDSAGRLRIEAVGTQVLQLNPDDTRALFRWLDQLTGTGLQRLVEREAA